MSLTTKERDEREKQRSEDASTRMLEKNRKSEDAWHLSLRREREKSM